MRTIAAFLALAMTVQGASPAPVPAQPVDWNGLGEQVRRLRLKDHRLTIGLSDGAAVQSRLRRYDQTGLVVASNKSTRPFGSAQGESLIPRSQIASVRFEGTVGRRGLVGGLAGLGAGGAITGAVAANMTGEGQAGAAILVIPVLTGIVGCLIGRAARKPAPAYQIVPGISLPHHSPAR